MHISPQSQQLYQVLLTVGQPLSVKKLASQLNIVPNSVYRLVKPLESMGLIKKDQTRPIHYSARSPEDSLGLYLLQQSSWFDQAFTFPNSHNKNSSSSSHDLQFSFIQSRDELMSRSTDEAKKAQTSIDLLRSGHEIPPDLLLELHQAQKRGVTTRMLIQDYGTKNHDMVTNWQKNGISVKHTPLKRLRLMTYDSHTTYFMSYKHSDSSKDLGMKVTYPPFSAILTQLFDTWWQQATTID